VFSIRDLEEEMRPIAMYLILDFIWTKIRKSMKRRILIVDEGWYLMKHPDSASFLNSIAKRSRKYYLGVTTITQDVEDFMAVDLGKAIIQNSSLQILLKQSSAAIDRIADVFYLSEGEKHLLLSCETGEGLFFAGPAHAAMRVIASPEEHALVTTKPQELEAMRVKEEERVKSQSENQQVPPPQAPTLPIFHEPAPQVPPTETTPTTTPPPQEHTTQESKPFHLSTVVVNDDTSGLEGKTKPSPQEPLPVIQIEPILPTKPPTIMPTTQVSSNRPLFTVETVSPPQTKTNSGI
jgi:hypothetical protein